MDRWYATSLNRALPEFVRRHYTNQVHSALCALPVVQTVIGVFSAFINSLALGIFLCFFGKDPEAHDAWCDRQAQNYREQIVSIDEAYSRQKVQELNDRYEERARSVLELKGEHARLVYGIFEGIVSAIPVVGTLFHTHRLYYGTDPACLQKYRPIEQTT